MGVVCCLASSLVRIILFVFNLAFVICGIALIVLGAVFLHELKNYDAVLEDGFTVVPIMCIVVGSIVFLIAFFGCFGAMTHQKCMLKTYAIALCVILVCEIVMTYYAFKLVNNVDFRKDIENKFIGYVENYENQNNETQLAVDAIQKYFKCCGVNNYKDYSHHEHLPKSCCNLERISTVPCNPESSDLYKDGCMHPLDDALDFVYKVLGWVCGTIGLVLLGGIVFGFCLGFQ